jgi:hypothetical protein
MTAPAGRRRATMWGAALLVFTAALVAIALGHSSQIEHPVLGAEWQCTRMAFLTSCTRTGRPAPRNPQPANESGPGRLPDGLS